MIRLLLALVVLLPAAAPLAAQDDRWQITLDGRDYVWDVRLDRLEGDSLVVREADTLRPLPVERITEMRLIRKSEMRLGEGGAGAMSALMGGDDEVYDFTPLEFAERMRAIQKILLLHPAEEGDDS